MYMHCALWAYLPTSFQTPLVGVDTFGDDVTAKALEQCKKKVLKPYHIFLKTVGLLLWLALFDEQWMITNNGWTFDKSTACNNFAKNNFWSHSIAAIRIVD